MIISENKMDHSEMPALADGLTAGYDKQNCWDEPKFAQKNTEL